MTEVDFSNRATGRGGPGDRTPEGARKKRKAEGRARAESAGACLTAEERLFRARITDVVIRESSSRRTIAVPISRSIHRALSRALPCRNGGDNSTWTPHHAEAEPLE
ncbi:hypothetical protein KC19_10G047500 [Ceratodon purpureus]|uniref:Uncharacterized protein n=1 Tax=Ceratodon purpureus TaxID=3225 RepID=A0A8T0GLT2_CERPU|nr:hypothetical protein KC19_10G047500 [Ceratodon purpureus]